MEPKGGRASLTYGCNDNERIMLKRSIMALCCWVGVGALAESPVRCAPEGVALGGFDVVSYHSAEAPVQGEADITVEHDGFVYRFVSEANRDLFVADPIGYLPRYLGWCATTLAMGRLACPDFTNYKIEDGSLLLFELAGFTNGRLVWDSDPSGFRRRADANAARLLD